MEKNQLARLLKNDSPERDEYLVKQLIENGLLANVFGDVTDLDEFVKHLPIINLCENVKIEITNFHIIISENTDYCKLKREV
jgi:hypothetical protein